ncbi:hypothetical protein ATANTOWER_008552 [Ataeniobius toweri]|uniref:Maturase K n=1 Tax=Ataeniobius toweri TaxID=208326 RepID=A0ABU7AQ69_9TELE|nr:hypothetical protein [Ataeniobius toweri]
MNNCILQWFANVFIPLEHFTFYHVTSKNNHDFLQSLLSEDFVEKSLPQVCQFFFAKELKFSLIGWRVSSICPSALASFPVSVKKSILTACCCHQHLLQC